MARNPLELQDDLTEANVPPQAGAALAARKPPASTLSRVAKYVIVRAIVLSLMLVVGVFIAIIVANLGGFVDDMVRDQINGALMGMARSMQDVPAAEKLQWLEDTRAQMEEAAGLNRPFLLRCLLWLPSSLALNWGEADIMGSLPNTLLLFGTASLLLFLLGIVLSLFLSRRYGSWLDRLIVTLSPLSSAPSWAHGIILVIIFAVELRILPFGGMLDSFPPGNKLGYALVVAKHMILPVLAILLSVFFQSVYAWRTYFLIHSGEDYVELAKIKGLPGRMIERRYILRPALPYLITSFTLLLLSFWQGAIALEYFFHWPGLGDLYINSIRLRGYNPGVVVSIVVVFAYILTLSVFILDVVYAMVDPRVRVGGGRLSARSASTMNMRMRLARLRSRLRSVGRRGRAGSRAPRAAMGLRGLDRVLRDFLWEEDAQADWLLEPGTGRQWVVDRLYPELGLAVRTTNHRDVAERAFARACRQAGIALVTVDPDQLLSPRALHQLSNALSAASRRVAQQQGAGKVKLDLMPRIAAAKAACEQRIAALTMIARPVPPRTRATRRDTMRQRLDSLGRNLQRMRRYPSAMVGLAIILILIGVSIYTVVAIPYDEVVSLWRGDENNWYRNPRNAQPVWVNLFRRDKLPPTVVLDSRDSVSGSASDPGKSGLATKRSTVVSEGMTEILLSFALEYPYAEFPQDLAVYFQTEFEEKRPQVSLTWLTPDGREIDMGSQSIVSANAYYLSQDDRLQRKLGGEPLREVFFTDPDAGTPVPLQGRYELQISGFVFEEDADLDAEFVIYGQVYGPAGTDHRRRDLTIALLWGAPVALTLGFFGAVCSSLATMLIAAVGVWFGGWVDDLLQRITEVNMILPTLPICIMVYFMYTKSVWIILAIAILLSVFGSAVKNYRAAFLQVKESPYIEAARAYGAGDRRIILRYLIPHILPVLIPQLVAMVPGYVFLEATLAILGLSDPILPTWGKLVYDALTSGAYQGHYYWLLEPLALLMLTGLAFAMLGFALDRLLNPRLRER